MKKLLILVLGLPLFVSACEVQPTVAQGYWKTGSASGAQRQNDFTSCQLAALREVPRALATGQTPTYTTPIYRAPAHTSCYGYGYSASCTTTGGNITGGQTYGGQIYTYDANEDLRARVEYQCMVRKGYSLLALPVCTADQRKLGVVPKLNNNKPLPSEKSVLCLAEDGYVAKPGE